MYTVAGTTQLCKPTMSLGLPSSVHCCWDYSGVQTVAGITQLYTLLLGLPDCLLCYCAILLTLPKNERFLGLQNYKQLFGLLTYEH
jgi:hypothetical protein